MIDARIVADSSANLAVNGGSVVSVPLKIITDQKEYVDDANLNTTAMVWDLQAYTGKSSTACPSPRIGWKPSQMPPMSSALPSPVTSPAAATLPPLPKPIMRQVSPIGKSASSTAFPPAVRWS